MNATVYMYEYCAVCGSPQSAPGSPVKMLLQYCPAVKQCVFGGTNFFRRGWPTVEGVSPTIKRPHSSHVGGKKKVGSKSIILEWGSFVSSPWKDNSSSFQVQDSKLSSFQGPPPKKLDRSAKSIHDDFEWAGGRIYNNNNSNKDLCLTSIPWNLWIKDSHDHPWESFRH